LSTSNLSSTLCRPAAPSRVRSCGSRNSDSSALASPSTSLGATSSPLSPSRTISGTAASRVETIGRALAIASRITVGKMSLELSQINAVVDAVNFSRCVGALVDEQFATVVAHCDDERSFAAHFAQQLVAAHIKHKVLRVRREAETDFGDFLDEERGVGRVTG